MARFVPRSDAACPWCGISHPTVAADACPCHPGPARTGATRAADATDLADGPPPAPPVAPPSNRPVVPSVAERARAAVATAPAAIQAAVAETAASVEGAGGGVFGDDPELSSQREWLARVAAFPWGSPAVPPVNVARARAALAAAHGGHPGLHAILGDRLAALAHLASRPGTAHRIRPLLLVGPPGTGKSTVATALARGLGRPVAVVPLATVAEDDVFLVGVARTYRSAEPGGIVRAVQRAGTRALVLVLDEVDKASGPSRHGAASAMHLFLDLLDGAATFTDRYFGAAIDLSPAVIVATANTLAPLPAPLLDRFEVVAVPPLTPAECYGIARTHLWPRLTGPNGYGLTPAQVVLTPDALEAIVCDYAAPDEAGLRGVETRLEACLQRALSRGAPARRVWITPTLVAERLGPPPRPRRAIGFRAGPAGPEPDLEVNTWAVSPLRLPVPTTLSPAPSQPRGQVGG